MAAAAPALTKGDIAGYHPDVREFSASAQGGPAGNPPDVPPWGTNQRGRELPRALRQDAPRRYGLCKSGNPSEWRSSSSVVPARSWDRLSRSATATRMSVFVVIRSPAPPRLLFSTRARIERLVIWSGHISSSLRSRRRYLGSLGIPAGACGRRAGRKLAASGACTSVLRTSGVRCSGVCTSAGDGTAGRTGMGGAATGAESIPVSDPRLAGLTPTSSRRPCPARSAARPEPGGRHLPRNATNGHRGRPSPAGRLAGIADVPHTAG